MNIPYYEIYLQNIVDSHNTIRVKEWNEEKQLNKK
jgi:hypothetical protein